MWHFFTRAESPRSTDLPVPPELEFQGRNATGLIEKRTAQGEHFALLLAGGIPIGAYHLSATTATPISPSDVISMPAGQQHVVELPDAAGRLVWLALESSPKRRLSLSGGKDWQEKRAAWQASHWSGLVEILAGAYQAFVFFWQGDILAVDAALYTPQGFVAGLSAIEQIDAPQWEVTLYEWQDTSPAYQYFILRQATVRWCHKILRRYQELVGRNLLLIMDREVNRSLQPWNWRLELEDDMLHDAHFFPRLQSAAHAYRALFMGIGAQMSFMIGDQMAQRLFSEAFETNLTEEIAALQTQRLIPAAFTD